MTDIKRPILRYHGGKFLLAPWIISHFPRHRNYVECFGGAGSVLFRKPRSHSEVYNDKWDTVVNVFKVLRDPEMNRRLQELLELTPYARTEFDQTHEDFDNTDPLELARRTILRSFGGFGSAATSRAYKTGFRANNRSNGTNCAVDWNNYPLHLAAFCERLKGVVIENRDYRDIMEQQDSQDTLFFLDPPYVHDTRNVDRKNGTYVHEFADQDHIDMAAVAKELKGMVVICGYDCDLYLDLFRGWHLSRKAALADGARPRTECLWLNEAAYRGMPKKELFT
jgi:DNA adenine methylase